MEWLLLILLFIVMSVVFCSILTGDHLRHRASPISHISDADADAIISMARRAVEMWCADCAQPRESFDAIQATADVTQALDFFAEPLTYTGEMRTKYLKKKSSIVRMVRDCPIWSSQEYERVAGREPAKAVRQNILLSAFLYHMCDYDESNMVLAPNAICALSFFLDEPAPGEPQQPDCNDVSRMVQRVKYHAERNGLTMMPMELIEDVADRRQLSRVQNVVLNLMMCFAVSEDFLTEYLKEQLVIKIYRELSTMVLVYYVSHGMDSDQPWTEELYNQIYITAAGMLAMIGCHGQWTIRTWDQKDLNIGGRAYVDALRDVTVYREAFMPAVGKIDSDSFFEQLKREMREQTSATRWTDDRISFSQYFD